MTEFCILSPILLLLLVGGLDLNLRLEEGIWADVAARNLAAKDEFGGLNQAREAAMGELEIRRGRDLLVEQAYQRLKNQESAADESLKVGLTEVSHEGGDEENDKVNFTEARLKGILGTDSETFRNVSRVQGIVASGADLLDSAVNLRVIDGVRLFPEDQATVSGVELVLGRRASLVRRGVASIAEWVIPSSAGDPKIGPSVSVSRFFLRKQSAYHPNAFQYQSLVSYLLAISQSSRNHWGSPAAKDEDGGLMEEAGVMLGLGQPLPDSYNSQCLMNFTATDNCDGSNWYASVMLVVANIKGIVQLIGDVFGEGEANDGVRLGLQTATAAFETIVASEIKKGIEQGAKTAMDEMEGSLTEHFEKVIEEIENQANLDQLEDATSELSGRLGQGG